MPQLHCLARAPRAKRYTNDARMSSEPFGEPLRQTATPRICLHQGCRQPGRRAAGPRGRRAPRTRRMRSAVGAPAAPPGA
eukprot:9497221-Pyramimonas_sp.AAC.1